MTDDVEPYWYLQCIPYSDYLQTNWWKSRRNAYRESIVERYGRLYCQLCSRPGLEGIEFRFHVHHTTYDMLGDERDDDLALLCSACHNLVHFPDSHAAREWASASVNERLFLASRAANLDPKKADVAA